MSTSHSNLLRRLSARLLDALARSYRFNLTWREANRELVSGQQAARVRGITYGPPPARYGTAPAVTESEQAPTPRRDDGARALFVTARFRSGSTLLWNIFRHTPGVTAFYEPLNERQWFRGGADAERTDPTHLNAERYGAEYAGMADLAQWFDPAWTFRELYMDARSCDRRLARYLAELVARAPERPVLQCNRLDFRLPWLRRVFPHADVLLLYRNPREQWLSVQRSSSGAPPQRRLCPDETEDYFYTLAWARDLRRVFPCLDPGQHDHAYAVHYLLWRLSYLFGQQYADVSIAYEDLVRDCAGTLRPVFERFGINGGQVSTDAYAPLLKPLAPERWPSYASAAWFEDIEAACEHELARFLDA
ncbi:hypothetical protein CKO31_09680 [Thiohalocapsa halophila]|uniref:Sulfotransferase n=1 Tax=Thiohalocapsa halophila TaxID=69359 RepID=A0ABS1CGG0_9GAMM|nr:sulfotransferase [Thiohalocapsa halophila]MBK1631005.1 hypothetical protein [Thiohalocapsa halophila]